MNETRKDWENGFVTIIAALRFVVHGGKAKENVEQAEILMEELKLKDRFYEIEINDDAEQG